LLRAIQRDAARRERGARGGGAAKGKPNKNVGLAEVMRHTSSSLRSSATLIDEQESVEQGVLHRINALVDDNTPDRVVLRQLKAEKDLLMKKISNIDTAMSVLSNLNTMGFGFKREE
jgi:hypothetical protein